MTESFEIQEFVKTNEPVKTIAYATGREEANKKFRKALENRRGKAIRMIQVVIDFTTMETDKRKIDASVVKCICGEEITAFTNITKEAKHHCGGCHKNFSDEEWGEHGEKHKCPALAH